MGRKRSEDPGVVVSTRVPTSVAEAFDEAARSRGLSRSEWLRRIVHVNVTPKPKENR